MYTATELARPDTTSLGESAFMGDLTWPATQLNSVLMCPHTFLFDAKHICSSTVFHNRLQFQIYANHLKQCTQFLRGFKYRVIEKDGRDLKPL